MVAVTLMAAVTTVRVTTVGLMARVRVTAWVSPMT